MENFNEEKDNLNNYFIDNDLQQNNLLLCNKCLCIPKIDINPYDHKISSVCPNNHEIHPISLDLYLKEELNKSIICSLCNKNNKLSDLIYCKNCLIILCQNCKNDHNTSHQTIKYSDINILCAEHNIKNNFICLTCSKEICNKCLKGIYHINHKTQPINEFLTLPDNNINENLTKALIINNKKEKKQIEIINDMLIKKVNKITEIKNIENQINKRLINNIKNYPENYNCIYNINNIIKNSTISEESYYEIVSNITNILENYIKNGNSGKDKLILIKRNNLKNIFFLIIFLISIIIITYFLGDNSYYKNNTDKNKDKDKYLHFNEQSNLLKLTEIITNEEQEMQMNNYIKDSIFNIIEQYNNLFNENNNKYYNISLNYKLIYKGSRDGDNIASFHKRCDNKSNLLFMSETNDKTKYGFFSFKGYIDIKKEGIWIKDRNMFLFKFNDDDSKIKFYKNIGNDDVFYLNPSLLIEVKDKNEQIIYIRNDFFREKNYDRTNVKEGSFNFTKDFEINKNEKFKVKDIEVFQVIFKNNS